jgi:hypothetical protein
MQVSMQLHPTMGDGKLSILHQSLRGFVRALRAVRNTQGFQTETGVVTNARDPELLC